MKLLTIILVLFKMCGKLSKDKRDIYYRRAKEIGFRARSAFKLAQIDDDFHFLRGFLILKLMKLDAKRVVDLCSAPGGWTQVLLERCNLAETAELPNAKIQDRCSLNPRKSVIVAVDLQDQTPLEGVQFIQGDITRLVMKSSVFNTKVYC